MAKVTQFTNQKKAPLYDPAKSYKWEPTDVFELTGAQFASIYHCLTQEVRNSGGAPILLKIEAHNVLMDIFKQAVEQGVAKEQAMEDTAQEIDSSVNNLFNNKNS